MDDRLEVYRQRVLTDDHYKVHKWRVFFSGNLEPVDAISTSLSPSAWFLLWSTIGAERAWELIEHVTAICYMGEAK